MGDFNFNAPQYVDFTSPEELELRDYGDEYFDMDHEIEVEYQEVQCNQEEQVIEIIDVHPESDPLDDDEDEDDSENEGPKLRRSVSAGQILVTPKAQDEASDLGLKLESLQLSEKKTNNNKQRTACTPNILPSKSNLLGSKSISNSIGKLNKPLHQRPKAVSRDAINKVGLVKNEKLKRKMSVENLQPNKYISIAEAINKFQFGTPLRYHSKSSKVHFNSSKSTSSVMSYTVPHSPMLSTKTRSRQPTCLSRQEQEEMEADEMRKHQIKAQPVNYKILRAPVLNAKVDKKPNTVPEPFKFSEVQFHKPIQPQKEEVYEFHARPAPKTTAAPVNANTRRSVLPKPKTVPTTPSFMRKYRETLPKVQESHNGNHVSIKSVELQHDGLTKKIQIQKLVRTKIEPFSFEQRDKIIQQKKEEKIKKFLEEERKAREFHARPLPSKIASGSGQVESKVAKFVHEGSNSSLNSLKNDENMEPNHILFKAKPATVIHKKPFKPKKEDRPLLEISEFNLNSDKRAKEREEFEKKMKEKEKEYEKMKHEQTKRQKQLEMEEINKIRKETVHKANPVKHYKTLEIHPSTKKVTSPVSPLISKKRISRMEN